MIAERAAEAAGPTEGFPEEDEGASAPAGDEAAALAGLVETMTAARGAGRNREAERTALRLLDLGARRRGLHKAVSISTTGTLRP